MYGQIASMALNYLGADNSQNEGYTGSNLTRGLDFSRGKDWWKDSLTGFGILGDKKKKAELKDIRSEEQKKAAKILQDLAFSGSGGGINLGEEYSGDLGYYIQNANELKSLADLQALATGSDINTARNTYQDLANTEFDPSDPKSGYASFSRALAKAGAESADVLNREAAMTGSRFGTGIQKQKADLASDLANQRGQYLANIYQSGRQQQLAGAQGLQSLVGTQMGLQAQIQNQAALERQLKDQEARDKLTEFKRTRAEELMRIDLLTAESNRNPYVGISSLPASNASAGMSNALGSGIGSLLSGLFSNRVGSGVQGGTVPTSAQRATFGGSYAGATPSGYSGTIQAF